MEGEVDIVINNAGCVLAAPQKPNLSEAIPRARESCFQNGLERSLYAGSHAPGTADAAAGLPLREQFVRMTKNA